MWRRKSGSKQRDDGVRNAIGSERFGPGGEDHELWVRAWRSMPSRRLRELPRIDLHGSLPSIGEVISVTIAEVPAQFMGWLGVVSQTCLVCDRSTIGSDRRLVSVLPKFARGLQFIWGTVWVHAACFTQCPETGEPGPVPW